MLRLGLVAALVIGMSAGSVHASGTGRAMGMYPTTKGAVGTTPMPMLDSKVEVVVRGPIVETIVTQRFSNRTDRATEATYIFPLPPDAAVSAMWIKAGAKTIRAAVEKRDDAQRRYEAAVRAGVNAAVLDQERPDIFTQTVSAIPAKGTVEVTLRYDTVARYADGTWTLVLPMVVAPRYVPGTASGRATSGTGRAPDTDRAPDASRVTPATGPNAGGATAVTIELTEAVTDVTSPTHEIETKGNRITFVDPTSDHDAVIRWRAKAPAAGWVETASDGGYAAVVVEAAPVAARKGALRVMLVLDRAATMTGDATVAAQPFLRSMFAALGTADRVAVIGTDQVAWSAPADALRAVERAWTKPGGVFDLTRVLQAAKPGGAPLVLVSDGLVADDRAALAAARKLGVPIHVIGVGAAPARGLLTQIAAVTGGTIRFVLPGDDLVALAKGTLIDAGSSPVPLTVNWGTLVAMDVVPGLLPRLGAGQAMLVLARVKRAQSANARARGELFALEEIAPSRRVDGSTTVAGPLARRWARARLDDLLVANNPAVVTTHAIKFGLVSPYTSLVAIGAEVVVEGGVKHSVSVPVSVPAGMDWNEVKQATKVETTSSLKYKQDENDVSVTADKKSTPTPKPAKTDSRSKTVVMDNDGRADGPGDAEEDEEAPNAAPDDPVALAPSAGASYEADDAEVMEIQATSASYRRARRITASLGGGVAVQDETSAAVIALGSRLEFGRRTLLGVEGTLWLVDGFHGQGRFMFTFARRGIARWLELGAGVGAHLGGGSGPAGMLSLRVPLPPQPVVSGYLRYDGALLDQAQHTLTLGIEVGF